VEDSFRDAARGIGGHPQDKNREQNDPDHAETRQNLLCADKNVTVDCGVKNQDR
jgi:hypothetical protein